MLGDAGVLARWNGTAWAAIGTQPSPDAGHSLQFGLIDADRPNSIWALGSTHAGSSVIYHGTCR